MKERFEKGVTGVYEDVPADQYHAAMGVSNSMLKVLARSPAHLDYYMKHGMTRSTAMLEGSILDDIMLEKRLPWWIVQPPDIDKRTKAGKDWVAANADKEIITSDQWKRITGMRDAVMAHPAAADAFDHGVAELSLFAEDHATGLLKKGRLDLQTEGNAIVDLKSAADASPGGFARQAGNLRYYMQAAYYLDLWNSLMPTEQKEYFVFVAVESSPPHAVGVYMLEEQAIDLGRDQYRTLLETFKRCCDTGEWPGYNTAVTELKLPKYIWMQ